VRGIVPEEDILAVRSQPTVRMRIHVLTDGAEQEEQVPVLPDIASLAKRMLQIVGRGGQELLLANLLLRSRGLVEQAQQQVQESLDRRAWEVVDRYTWAWRACGGLRPV